MSQDERINYFTSLCEQLYNPAKESKHIQTLLENAFPTFTDVIIQQDIPHSFAINTPGDTASALRILLESSPNPYVQMFCLSRLKQLVQAQFDVFTIDLKIQLRSFLLEYAFMHPELLPFVVAQLASVLASITLLGWAEIEQYRDVHKDILQFIKASVDHHIVGIQILVVIVQDMNSITVKTISKLRKASAEFRDTQLFSICETGFGILKDIVHRRILFSSNQEQRLQEATLNLINKCFSFDFNGTNVEESGEDIGIIQIPTSWRPLFENGELVDTMFKSYHQFLPPNSSKAMECIVHLASVRKTLFTEQEDRSAYVVAIMKGIRNVIASSQGLSDSDNYNEFCRLLFRFRATIPLNEMVVKVGYFEWIEAVAQFSLQVFQSWRFAPNTAIYVLGFWSKIVQSMSYYRQLEESTVEKLESIAVELTRSYISICIESVPIIIEEGFDDPLENEESMIEIVNMLGQIGHCKYEESGSALIGLFDPITVQYQALITSNQITNPEAFRETLEVIETKFAWLVYTMGAFVGNRSSFLYSEDIDKVDSQITTKVLQLMDVQQSLQNYHGNTFMNEKLDMAFIYFFKQFKKTYMSESSGKEIYEMLSEAFGITDQVCMLDVFMRKIVSNLQQWSNNEKLVRFTLDLFNELVSGYGATKNLCKIKTTQMILQNPMPSEFSFFQNETDIQSDNRITYFQILSKLLFEDDDLNSRSFYEFMRPFDVRFNQLGPLNSIEAFQQSTTRKALRDLIMDLQGLITPIQERQNFGRFFDWFYEDYTSVLLRGLEAWSSEPISHSILSFYSEFVHNKSQRLNFDVASANGVLMFRDASQIICSYGNQLLKQKDIMIIDQDQKYDYKYKGISTCFDIISRCLSGRYINFGIIWLYQEDIMKNALGMTIQLMLSIPMEDLLSFPELTESFFDLLEQLTRQELMNLPTISPEAFLYIIQACEHGIESSNSSIRDHACSAILHMCSFAVKETEKAERSLSSPLRARRNSSIKEHWFITYLRQFPQTLPSLLASVFHLVLFDIISNKWSLSRSLYGLIILQRDYAAKYIDAVIDKQLPERKSFVSTSMKNLLSGILWDLSIKDRERFTQNVSNLKRLLSLNNVTLVPLSIPPPFH